MFCPQCGGNQSEDLRFCKTCGANLAGVRKALVTREPENKFDWSKTWVAEMLMTESEREKRREELDRQRGVTPESRSQKEIKAGVITASVGIGVAVFVYVIMQGIILSGNVASDVIPLLSRVWIAGVIPFLVGLGLLINGLFVRSAHERGQFDALREPQPPLLRPGETSEIVPPPFSVTESTTRQLGESGEQRVSDRS